MGNVSSARELARALLAVAAAEVEVPGELAAALVDAVLAAAAPEVRLALEVRDGGEHVARRLVELCEAVLRAGAVDVRARTAGAAED